MPPLTSIDGEILKRMQLAGATMSGDREIQRFEYYASTICYIYFIWVRC
jgi:hypothetical protein